MDFKLFGSILLIVGTTVGAGMLALPIATAKLGFVGAALLLFICWFIMTAGAFLLLEANLWVQQNSNLITMAGKTIGPIGQIIAWISYLLLLYSLLCAYIAGGSDLLSHLLALHQINLPFWLTATLFTLLFGMVVYLGIRTVDYTNRVFMIVKFSAYFILIALLSPYIIPDNLTILEPDHFMVGMPIMVTITSFGFAAIVPSLRVYFAGDVSKLKKAILIGSLIPLFCYLAWDMAIMGVIPRYGSEGLLSILSSQNSTSDLVKNLTTITAASSITFFAKLFTSICVVTSFLGVALCLSDFLADGLQLEKKGNNSVIIQVLTLLPPLLVVLFFPNIFIKALEYAGILCVVLLILLPAWMVWRGRYHKRFQSAFQVPGGKPLLILMFIVAIILMILSALD